MSEEGIDLTGLLESFNESPPIAGFKLADQIVTIGHIAFQVKKNAEGRVIMRRLLQNTEGEDYPGQTSEIRRERLIRSAVEAGDRILMDGTDGSVEELDYLTAAVMEKWVEKVRIGVQAKLLRRDMEARVKS